MAYICHPVTFLSSFSHFLVDWMAFLEPVCQHTSFELAFWIIDGDLFTTLTFSAWPFIAFQYESLNGVQKTASDGDLMAALRNNFFATTFYYGYVAKLETSVVFESTEFVFFNSLFYILIIALSLSETLYYFGILYLSYFVLF